LSFVHVEIVAESELVVVYFGIPDSLGSLRVFTGVATEEKGSVGFDTRNNCVFQGLGGYVYV
jgi:hypothetical protein